jgi:hypothetical protein
MNNIRLHDNELSRKFVFLECLFRLLLVWHEKLANEPTKRNLRLIDYLIGILDLQDIFRDYPETKQLLLNLAQRHNQNYLEKRGQIKEEADPELAKLDSKGPGLQYFENYGPPKGAEQHAFNEKADVNKENDGTCKNVVVSGTGYLNGVGVAGATLYTKKLKNNYNSNFDKQVFTLAPQNLPQNTKALPECADGCVSGKSSGQKDGLRYHALTVQNVQENYDQEKMTDSEDNLLDTDKDRNCETEVHKENEQSTGSIGTNNSYRDSKKPKANIIANSLSDFQHQKNDLGTAMDEEPISGLEKTT